METSTKKRREKRKRKEKKSKITKENREIECFLSKTNDSFG